VGELLRHLSSLISSNGFLITPAVVTLVLPVASRTVRALLKAVFRRPTQHSVMVRHGDNVTEVAGKDEAALRQLVAALVATGLSKDVASAIASSAQSFQHNVSLHNVGRVSVGDNHTVNTAGGFKSQEDNAATQSGSDRAPATDAAGDKTDE
jgi:hypothetical protein